MILKKKLRSRRRKLCESYLRVSQDDFQNELERTKEVYFELMESGMKDLPLPEEKQNFLNEILEQDFDQPKGLQYLFVMMLYCSPSQLPVKWRSRLSVPKWAAVYLHAWFNRGIPPVSAVYDESRLVNQLYKYAYAFPDFNGSLQEIRTAFSRVNGVQVQGQYHNTESHWFIPLFKARIVYTPVPKCACSSVKYFIFECERGMPYSPETNGNGRDIHQFYNTWKIITKEYAFTDNWLKVLIVREPVQRFISCFRDKVLSRKVLFSSKDELAKHTLPANPNFDVFVDNLERYRSLNQNIKHHTNPIAVFAKSPDFYDVVLNINELNRLSVLVADRSDCNIKRMPHNNKTRNSIDVEGISQQTVEKIRQFYAQDYKRYGRYF